MTEAAEPQPSDSIIWPQLKELVKVQSVEVAADIVRRNPALLTEEAERFASVLVETAFQQPDTDLRRKALWVREFLYACKRYGLDDVAKYSMNVPVDRATVRNSLLDQIDQLADSKLQTDIQRRVDLCAKLLALVDRTTEWELWARLQAMRASLLLQIEGTGRESRFRQGIELFRAAADAVDRKVAPKLWADYLETLAVLYLKCPTGTEGENAEQAIHCCTDALEVFTKQDDPGEWASVMNSKAAAYAQRTQGIKEDNLEVAREACLLALEVRTSDATPKKWAETMCNLAGILYHRHTSDRPRDIERAIQTYREALQVITKEFDPVMWAGVQNNLCAVYFDRVDGNRSENLETAIRAGTAALEILAQEKHARAWGGASINLSKAYLVRSQGDRTENIEVALRYASNALDVFPRGQFPEESTLATHALANAYRDRQMGDRNANQEKAIALFESLRDVVSQEAEGALWADVMNDFGIAYADRMSGDLAENIETAIGLFTKALEVRTHDSDPILWAVTSDNLASAYAHRIRGDRAENIERAVMLYEEALKVNTPTTNPEDWATTTMNLATAYTNRLRGDPAENMETAIRLYDQVLGYRTAREYPREWALAMINLGTAYRMRLVGDLRENVETVISIYKQLLQVLDPTKDRELWSAVQMNLGNALSDREAGERAVNLELAIEAYEQALRTRNCKAEPFMWVRAMTNLARSYAERQRGSHAEDVQRAESLCRQALTVARFDAMPDLRMQIQQLLGDLCFARENWESAAMAYREALKAIEFLFQTAATPEARQSQLRGTKGLPARLAYALAQCEELEEAVTVIENSRARILAEALALDDAPVEDLLPTERKAFEDVRGRIRSLQQKARLLEGQADISQFVKVSQNLSAAYVELKAVLSDIGRRLPGFLSPIGIQEVKTAAASFPLVYLMATSAGGLGLVVSQGSGALSKVWLPELREAALQSETQDYLDTYFAWRNSPQSEAKRAEWFSTLDRVLKWLWNTAISSLITELQPAKSVTLVPTGLLGLFPLHATWTQSVGGRSYALDLLTFRYAPSAAMLRKTALADWTGESALLVSEPEPTSLPRLLNAPAEIAAISALFSDSRSLHGTEALRTAVLKQAPTYNVLHFCCHGRADLHEPLQSGLVMANDEMISLRDLLEIRLGATRLAVLSACESGVPGMQLPDEVIGLPAGLLRAGVSGVAASLWSVADRSTMELMSRYYELWRKNTIEPAEALRLAQQSVRDSPENDFSHPYFWAAFAYTGR